MELNSFNYNDEVQIMEEDIANINNLIDKPKNELELVHQVMNGFITDVIEYYSWTNFQTKQMQ